MKKISNLNKIITILILVSLFLVGCSTEQKIEPVTYDISDETYEDVYDGKRAEKLYITKDYAIVICLGNVLEEHRVYYYFFNLTDSEKTFKTSDIELVNWKNEYFTPGYDSVTVPPHSRKRYKMLFEDNHVPSDYEYFVEARYKDKVFDLKNDDDLVTIKADQIPFKIKQFQEQLGAD